MSASKLFFISGCFVRKKDVSQSHSQVFAATFNTQFIFFSKQGDEFAEMIKILKKKKKSTGIIVIFSKGVEGCLTHLHSNQPNKAKRTTLRVF